MTQFAVPIAFFVFNRPELTARVFEVIRRIKPAKLLLIADGPRVDRPGEARKCVAVRVILEHVDWPCEVLRNYSDNNLGCKKRVSSGLDWVFEQTEEAIILEDDCLPHPTFFAFCQELLDKYREDSQVMMISGNNFLSGNLRTAFSYYFSRYPHIWGWASWKRAWRLYDGTMSLWQEYKRGCWLQDHFSSRQVLRYWEDMFSRTHDGLIDTWDYQLAFACLVNGGLCVVPDRNLVTNIGFGVDATHTRKKNKQAEVPLEAMEFPLHHPPFVLRDVYADELTENAHFSQRLLSADTPGKLLRYCNRLYTSFAKLLSCLLLRKAVSIPTKEKH